MVSNVINLFEPEEVGDLIYNKLDKAVKNNQIIAVGDMRGIGKTHTLVNYAKDHGYPVLVSTLSKSNILKEEYDYEKIYSLSEVIDGYSWVGIYKNFLVDDDVANDVPARMILSGFI